MADAGLSRPGEVSLVPRSGDFAPFYAPYVKAAVGVGVSPLEAMTSDLAGWESLLAKVPPEREQYRYAPGKWSIREVVGHVTDAERIFLARSLAFARCDPSPYPSFDENQYVAASGADLRCLASLADEFVSVRLSTLSLFAGFDERAWGRRGVASDVEFTVRGLGWIIAGHSAHHRKVLEDRYVIGALP